MVFKKSTLAVIAVFVVLIVFGVLVLFLVLGEEDQGTNQRRVLQQNMEQYAAYTEADGVVTTEATAITTVAVNDTASKGGYDAGYQAGYTAGVQDGNVQLSSAQAAEQAAYERGLADGKAGIVSDTPESHEDVPITVTVSGSFTAAVRAVLPDYQTDDTTLRAAVIQLNNDEMFVMKIAPEVCRLLTANETYTFLVDEQTVTVPDRKLLLEDNKLSADILKQQYIAVGSVRAPRNDESGVHSTRLTYKESDNKGENT